MDQKNENLLDITLESGNKVTLRKVLSAKDYLRLKNFIVSKAELQTKQSGFTKKGSPQMVIEPKIDGEAVVALEEETVKAYVYAFNGSSDNAYETMMDTISGKEYEQVKEKIDELHFLQKEK
ncbi:MAG: hypothetical protein D6822_04355 [Cyanobacteria bacterium J149]|nr:MAG: hypothetical protein D6822_04355 [Cyanobacteria bacterium J149]